MLYLKINFLYLFIYFTQLIQSDKDVFVVVNDTCITNSASAMFWTDKNNKVLDSVSEYKPPPHHCSISGNCKLKKWLGKPYIVQEEYYEEIITDKRWEGFKLHISSFTKTDGDFMEFRKIGDIKGKKSFKIPFSVRVKEAHVLLCDSADIKKSRCLWLIMGGWEGKVAGLRSCEAETVPQKHGIEISDSCYYLKAYNNYTRLLPYASNERWMHYMIAKSTDNTLTLWQNQEKVYTYRLRSDWLNGEEKVYLFIHGKRSIGYWKFHKHINYFTAFNSNVQLGEMKKNSKICMSMFVKICKNCQLHIKTDDDYTKQEYKNMGGMWKEIKFIAAVTKETPTYIQSLCPNCNASEPFYQISDPRYCNEVNEYRFLKAVNGNTCSLLNKNSKINIKETTIKNKDIRCDEKTFSTECLSCNLLNDGETKKCYSGKVCEIEDSKTTCTCTAGYFGNNCEKECPQDFYGFGCHECGNCVDQCNFKTGHCSPCNENFSGDNCNIPPSPMFKYVPKLEKIDNTYCVVKLENFEVYGNKTPAEYYYEIYDGSKSVTKSENIQFQEKKLTELNGLTSNTKYKIRAIVIASDQTMYDGGFVKFKEFKTNCKDIGSESLNITTYKNSAYIFIKDNPEECPYKWYTFHSNNKNYPANNRKISILNLETFKNYMLMVKRNNSEVFYTSYKTQEGPPGKIESPKAYATSTTLTLTWDLPNPTNGIIRGYTIFCQKIYNIGCMNTTNTDEVITIETKQEHCLLENLHPYTYYNITIVAFTVEEGKAHTFEVNTKPTENLSSSELSTIISRINTSDPTTVKVITKHIECEHIEGPIIYKFTARCLEDWCKGNVTNTQSNNFTENKIANLIPFSYYSLELNVCRDILNCGDKTMRKNFRTNVSVPNAIKGLKVYSKDSASISLNWFPPYPPTGDLYEYKIEYKYTNGEWEEVHINPTSCPLWPNLHCATIGKQLNYKNHTILIKLPEGSTASPYTLVLGKVISSRNKSPERFNEEIEIETVQELEPSEAPYNLTADWTNNNYLHLSWNHPNITNGNLSKFIIHFYNSNDNLTISEIFPLEYYNLVYKYVVNVTLKSSTNYTIKITAYNYDSRENRSLEGITAFISTTSPPSIPILTDILTKQNSSSNTTLNLILKGLQDIQLNNKIEKIYIFIFMNSTLEELDRTKITNINEKKIVEQFPHHLILIENIKCSYSNIISRVDYIQKTNSEEYEIKYLMPATYYNITIILSNHYMHMFRYNRYSGVFRTNGDPISSNHSLFALLILVILALVVIGYIYRRKKKGMPIKPVIVDKMLGCCRLPCNLQNTTDTDDDLVLTKTIETPPIGPRRNKAFDPKNEPTIKGPSKLVQYNDFENYVKVSIENGELDHQHSLFPKGQTKPWDYGITEINKPKNRYNNMVAYDHSRVKLKKINNDEYSDYINANYIDGYKVPQAYIATQGPKKTTLNDFWRMIWQENVKHIVMLANIIEGGKVKVSKYWPEINNSMTYGDIIVQYLSSHIFSDYEYRIFQVTCNNIQRKIEHLHFTSWPDHGIPLYCQSLVPFLRKMLTIPNSSKSPIVVHCSAGVGRTGTIILCDTALRMAARDGALDLLNILHKMRSSRPSMVDNEQQYKLAHLTVLECLMGMKTSIQCNEHMKESVNSIITSEKLSKQMQYLLDTSWQDQTMKSVADELEPMPNYPEKNRDQDIIPENQGRIFISRYPSSDEQSSYINAVFVDGFKSPRRFIVTQNPLPNTVGDFWRLVSEMNINAILSLNEIDENDQTSCKFWPTKEYPVLEPVHYIILKYNKTRSFDYCDIISINIQYVDQDQISTVNILQMKHWPSNQPLPTNGTAAFLNFCQEVHAITRNSKHVIVTCFDGAKASGIYVAMSFIIDKMNLEQECDVCQAVRHIRHNRRQFIQTEEQFKFLYRTAVAYINGFESYANFN